MAAVIEKEVEREVFARTPEAIPGETCDSCGNSVVARYQATKDSRNLFFCAHHIRRFEFSLKEKGFSIFPEAVDYQWPGVALK